MRTYSILIRIRLLVPIIFSSLNFSFSTDGRQGGDGGKGGEEEEEEGRNNNQIKHTVIYQNT